jgi:hypothetical protein
VPFFGLRKMRAERAAATAAGNPPALSEKFSQPAKVKIALAMGDNRPQRLPYAAFEYKEMLTLDVLGQRMSALLVRDWGYGLPAGPLWSFLTNGASDAEVVEIIEAWFTATRGLLAEIEQGRRVIESGGNSAEGMALTLGDAFRHRVNEILDDHDIGWQLAGDEMIPRSSTFMHSTIVEPVLALTAGRPALRAVEQAFQKALVEMKPGGDPADAITHAGTALQEMLEAVGAKGSALGDLVTDARKRGLLAPYDSKLADAVKALGDWVSADRSNRGSAHHVRDASREDAWLAIRVAGALILRLAAGKKR